MSQSAMPQTAEEFDPVQDVGPGNEFDYKPVPVTAPVTLCLGLCSALSLLTVFGMGISLFGIVLGLACLRQIRRFDGEMGGRTLARIGLSLSVIFFCSGSVLHAYTYHTEVPEGFQRLNFSRDISKKGFVVEEGRTDVHPEVKALDGQKVFLKGYMYPTRQTTGLTSFVMVKDNQQCCFGGNPELTDMILVEMQNGKTVDFRPSLVSVAGVFRLLPQRQGGQLSPIYQLEGIQFEAARTSF